MKKVSTGTQVRATIRLGPRSYSEVIDLEREREHFDESWCPGRTSWEEYIRPVKVTDENLHIVNGNHFLFGWLEGIFQSDCSPAFCLEEFNKGHEYEYEVTWEEGNE